MIFNFLNMVKQIDKTELPERIKSVLAKYGSTQRWFANKLVEEGLEMTDTKLSNRMNGVVEFTDEETLLIDKVLDKLS